MARTLHSWSEDFWRRIPLPIAELGTQLVVDEPQYVPKLFALTEATFALGVAYGMARARQLDPRWPDLAAKLAPLYRKSALGNRLRALDLLHRKVPGASGWDPSAPSRGTAGLVNAMFPDQASEAPTVRQGMNALVRARNVYAHPSTGASPPLELLRKWEEALQAMLEANPLFIDARLMHVSQVSKEPPDGWSFVAESLQGAFAMPYRKGSRQSGPGFLQPRRVYLRMPDRSFVELHPFVAFDDRAAFVLGQLDKTPRLWRPLTGTQWMTDLSADYDLALPGWREDITARPVAPAGPSGPARTPRPGTARAPMHHEEEPEPALPVQRWLPGTMRWMAALGLLGVLLLAGIGLTVAWLVSGGESPGGGYQARPGSAASGPGLPSPPIRSSAQCQTTVSGPLTASSLPAFLSGVELHWGDQPEDLERACGLLPAPSGEECTQSLLEYRKLRDPSPVAPDSEVSLPFHDRHGLFEVLVWTDVSVDEMVRRIEPSVGSAPRVDEDPVHWDFGYASLSVGEARNGRTLVKAWHEEHEGIYWDERCEVCKCRRGKRR